MCLDVQQLVVLLELNLVTAANLGLGKDVELCEQVERLLLYEARQGLCGVAVVCQAALRCFLFPFLGIAVAVEDDALMIGERLLDVGDGLLDRKSVV